MGIFVDEGGQKMITGNVTVWFFALAAADTKDNKFKVNGLIPKTDLATVNEIEQLITAVQVPAGLPLQPYFRQGDPVRDGDAHANPDYNGYWMFRAKTGYPVGVVDLQGADYNTALQPFYNGCIVQLCLHAYSYPAQSGGTAGASIGLDAVCVIDVTTPQISSAGGAVNAAQVFAQGGAPAAGARFDPNTGLPIAAAPAAAAPVAVAGPKFDANTGLPIAVAPVAVAAVPAAAVPVAVAGPKFDANTGLPIAAAPVAVAAAPVAVAAAPVAVAAAPVVVAGPKFDASTGLPIAAVPAAVATVVGYDPDTGKPIFSAPNFLTPAA